MSTRRRQLDALWLGQEVLKSHVSGRVGSGRVGSGRVGSGQKVFKSHGSGRANLIREGFSCDLTRPATFDLVREKPWL